MASPDAKQWERALDEEVKQLETTGTFKWVHKNEVPPNHTTIGSNIVWRAKRDGDGIITKYKSRIVAQGFSQVPGQDYEMTYASVAKFTTLRALLSLAACEDWEVHHVDVKGAYLQGDLEEEIYMRPPKGVKVEGNEDFVWRLLKSLYGLKQAGRNWKKKLETVLLEFGFVKSDADDCLYIWRVAGIILLLLLVYVDDMLCTGKEQ